MSRSPTGTIRCVVATADADRPSGAIAPDGRVIKQASGLAEFLELRAQLLRQRASARERNILE